MFTISITGKNGFINSITAQSRQSAKLIIKSAMAHGAKFIRVTRS